MTNTAESLSDAIKALGIAIPEQPKSQAQQPKNSKITAYDLMMLEFENSRVGGLTECNCTECKNRGYIYRLNDDGFLIARECRCMPERRYIRMMESSGLGAVYKKFTFDAYKADTDFRKNCKGLAMQYVLDSSNAWLMFSGQSGVGKTHLCTAICSELAKCGRQIVYVQWKRVLAKLMQTKFKETEQDEILAELQNADVLYIDDFLKTPNNQQPNDEALSYALEVINCRYFTDKKTLLSSEFMISDILRMDEALGGRIAEKSKGHWIQVKHEEGRNYRIRNE